MKYYDKDYPHIISNATSCALNFASLILVIFEEKNVKSESLLGVAGDGQIFVHEWLENSYVRQAAKVVRKDVPKTRWPYLVDLWKAVALFVQLKTDKRNAHANKFLSKAGLEKVKVNY